MTDPFDPSSLTRTIRTRIKPCPDEGCECWLWTGALDTSGYSAAKVRGKNVVVHRYVYEHFFDLIPNGLTVDHLCQGHRNCLNPAHFELVTRSENSIRANRRRWGPNGRPLGHQEGDTVPLGSNHTQQGDTE